MAGTTELEQLHVQAQISQDVDRSHSESVLPAAAGDSGKLEGSRQGPGAAVPTVDKLPGVAVSDAVQDKPSVVAATKSTTDVGPTVAAAPKVTWTGTYDLYRSGTFTTQKTWTWCTAASTQLMLNITLNQQDHSRASQQRYIRYEHHHDLYADGQAQGSDPLGWASAINHFEGTSDYHVVTSVTFDDAIWQAAKQLRASGKPVGLAVMNGNHAWVMTGFSATADPAATADFTVTDVMVVGPLYPMQQKHGYDMAPDTSLSIDRLRTFFGPYADDLTPNNPWQGFYITVQP